MKTNVQQWGNSLAVRLPRALAREVGVTRGAAIDLRVEGGRLVARPVRRRSYPLAHLLARVRPSNLHGAMETGSPVGRETW